MSARKASSALTLLSCLALALGFCEPRECSIGASTGLSGRVTDSTGASIPDATVTIVRPDIGERRIVKTNESGDWEAHFLTPGQYQLIFERVTPSLQRHEAKNASLFLERR